MAEERGAGPEKKPLLFRAGDGFEWDGMRPDSRRAGLPANSPSQIVNMRFKDKRLEGRGGQELIATHSREITGMIDFFTEIIGGTGPVPEPIPAMLLIYGQNGFGQYIYNDPTPLRHISLGTPGDGGPFRRFWRDASGNRVYSVDGYNAPAEAELWSYNSVTEASTRLFTIPTDGALVGPYYDFTGAVVQGTDLLVSANVDSVFSGATIGSVFKWDGVSLTKDHDFTLPISASISYGGGSIWFPCATSGSTNKIKARSSGGAWSDITTSDLSNIPISSYDINSRPTVFAGKLYISYGNMAYELNGTTLTPLDYTVTGISNVGPEIITSFHADGSNLYYLWANATEVKIGKFDGASWNPNYIDLVEKFPLITPSKFRFDTSFSIINGSMYITSLDAGAAQNQKLYISSGSDYRNTWYDHLIESQASYPLTMGTILGFEVY